MNHKKPWLALFFAVDANVIIERLFCAKGQYPKLFLGSFSVVLCCSVCDKSCHTRRASLHKRSFLSIPRVRAIPPSSHDIEVMGIHV